MSSTIREHVRVNMPETYNVLTAEASATMDGQERPDVVGIAISSAMSYFFPSGDKKETDLTPFQAQYVGAYATRLVIPAGIDYYMVRTGTSDAFNRGAGVTPLGGEQRQNYNRVQALKDLDAMLEKRLATMEAAFNETLATSGSTTAGMMIDSTPDKLLTLDPYKAMPRPDNAPPAEHWT